jgi:hypothetical protein
MKIKEVILEQSAATNWKAVVKDQIAKRGMPAIKSEGRYECFRTFVIDLTDGSKLNVIVEDTGYGEFIFTDSKSFSQVLDEIQAIAKEGTVDYSNLGYVEDRDDLQVTEVTSSNPGIDAEEKLHEIYGDDDGVYDIVIGQLSSTLVKNVTEDVTSQQWYGSPDVVENRGEIMWKNFSIAFEGDDRGRVVLSY